MKVEVNFKMKHILKRNVDSLHHLHLNHHHHRCSRRRQQRQYQQQQQSTNNNHHPNHLQQRNVDQLLTVKRALFVDSNLLEHHHQTSELLKAEMDKIEEEQCAKYNFDFKNELPLKGNYQWIKMTTESSQSPQSPPSAPPASSTITTTTTTTSKTVETADTSTASSLSSTSKQQ